MPNEPRFKKSGQREYLGDGLYGSFDNFYVWIESYNGVEVLNEVAIEDTTALALIRFLKTHFGERVMP